MKDIEGVAIDGNKALFQYPAVQSSLKERPALAIPKALAPIP